MLIIHEFVFWCHPQHIAEICWDFCHFLKLEPKPVKMGENILDENTSSEQNKPIKLISTFDFWKIRLYLEWNNAKKDKSRHKNTESLLKVGSK